MARPQRNNVDYFPHPVIHGRKMFVIEQKFQNDGYAVWFKLIEQLGNADFHYLDFRDRTQIIYLVALFRVPENTLIEILDMLAELDAIHSGLWKQHKIIFSEKFVESVVDAYARRNNKCIDFDGLCEHLSVKCKQKPGKCSPNANKNPQSKVKDSKEKKSKIKHMDFVSLTTAELEKLELTHGKPFASECIRVLNNYKGSSGKKYKSDYMAILNWVVDRVEKDGIKPVKSKEVNKQFKVEKMI